MSYPVKSFLAIGLVIFYAITSWAQTNVKENPPFLVDQATEIKQAIALDIIDLQGKSLSLSDFKGKVLLLNFWATWCLPCTKELPQLDRLQSQLNAENFIVLAVNVMESTERVNNFLKDKSLPNIRFLLDPKGHNFKAYGVLHFPTSYLIDAQGRLLARMIGPRDWESAASLDYFRNFSQG